MKEGMIAVFDVGRAATTRRPVDASTRLASSHRTRVMRGSFFHLSPLLLLLALLTLPFAACSGEPTPTRGVSWVRRPWMLHRMRKTPPPLRPGNLGSSPAADR